MLPSGVRIIDKPLDAHLAELLDLRARIDEEIQRLTRTGQPRLRRSRYEIPACGTETAYQRHHYLGEEADESCKAAHRIHNRVQEIRRKAS